MNHQFNEMDWPEETAVKVVKGAGDKKLAVFMDPFCVYCKKLSKETLANMNNITIYVYLWPILGEESEEMASAILSSSNRAKALVDWMKFDQMPNGLSSEAFDQILDKNRRLAERLGLHGTPAIFLSDGRGPFTAMSPTALAAKLSTETA